MFNSARPVVPFHYAPPSSHRRPSALRPERSAGALQHILVRGIERRKIFGDDRDRDAFLDRLGRILQESATPCYGWALMPNHVHLLLRTGQMPMATVMRRLLTGDAGTFNRRHLRHGPLVQNRYKST